MSVNGDRSFQIQRTTRTSWSRRSSSRSFSATTASAAVCPGRSSRPYFTSPSNSPARRCASHQKSTVPTWRPDGSRTSCCRSGVGIPAHAVAHRLRDSPGLPLRPSANATTRRARGTPGQPF